MPTKEHEPVLRNEVMEALQISPGETALDATLGGAGHFEAILAALGEGGTLVGIDADPAAVERAREAYAADRRTTRPTAHLVNDNFRNLARVLERLHIGTLDVALFDLGWSAYQLDALRGFSFSALGEPLLMTYGEGGEGETAAAIVNTASEGEIADILLTYGEERFARQIAREIVARRSHGRILTVGELVEAINAAVPSWYRERRTHAATKTFQALRIATNDEFGALKAGLAAALDALAEGGRLAVITFHSAEDRIVKQLLKESEGQGAGAASKKPIVPTRAEVLHNRRARSAKLRVFTKGPAGKIATRRGSEGASGGIKPAKPLLSYV